MTRTDTRPDHPSATYASGGRGVFDLVLAAFVAVLLISNIGATKLIQFGPSVDVLGFPVLPIITDGGAFLFPLAYIIGDVLAEVYGMRRARRAIITGFVMAAIMSLTFLAVDAAPPATDWPNQAAWSAVLGFVPRIVLASLVGFLVGQFVNAWVLTRIKDRFGEQHLWVRLITSTLVGEFADTVLFCTIAFGPLGAWLGGGSIPAPQLINYILVGWIYKVLVEVLFLPVTYRVVAAVKRREPDYARADVRP
ncbi:MAG: queuosine precursor transporter [Propionibacteriaceae bacterium]|nr:queuosine precursor transporter [Propionibacteriaceae bacterium]